MSTPEEMAQKRREVDAVRLKLEASSKQQRQWATQYMENAMVLRQLEDVGEDGGAIYKMMGGVLVKQEHVEAVSNVQKRMEFIKQEEERCVKRQQELQEEAAKIMA